MYPRGYILYNIIWTGGYILYIIWTGGHQIEGGTFHVGHRRMRIGWPGAVQPGQSGASLGGQRTPAHVHGYVVGAATAVASQADAAYKLNYRA